MALALIDTHLHLLYPDQFSYEWCAGIPALQGAFTLEDYRKLANGANRRVHIESAIFMEVDVPVAQQAAEADFFARMADRDRGKPPLMAVIASARPESPDFPAQLAKLAADVRVRGLRRVLHTVPDETAQTDRFAENIRLLAPHELTFDLCARPHQLPFLTTLVERCPQVQFVLDHCGVPDIAGGGLDPWRDSIRALAKLPNVACKVSGLASCAAADWPLTPQVQPYFDHCLECFYPERLIWGSDWPVCNLPRSLEAWLDTTADLLGALSEHEQAAIGTGNANRIYRLN
jgi:predicted TIM-barrel fold metal-dependent hydrolase